ncbi:CBS domain containing protein [Tolumonas auensis DSM 9187]|jgi:magnesium and cobalt transporter|uniref:Magnesium and cobalt efflux protein CorC n=1 Tax=Tolumonas auensis (strain DSM 9187 / NBRC 110442 / TA 4) TaxID=595494 RepID=C4LBN9_TOLAT|nr:CNNM family magnesium/cobalt transport protein CorC [Tolumonas auensis]ACQ94313.1 CBS domain containing protein [Tolumonas auensis DSM 9187]NCB57071.1 magnesium/cobalt transporter CorC [Gammaproteobacteria bacterium]
MSDEYSHSSHGSSRKKWLERLSHLFQGEPKDRNDLVEVIQDAEERDVIDEDTKEMIEGVLEVSELRVRDIMIPRTQMITIRSDQPVSAFLPMIIRSAHSRFPVISDDKDHVDGILLAKDLLPYGFGLTSESFDFEKVLRPAVVVPESKRVDRLLKEFQQQRYHMAIVVDEFGSVSGLVTIEDILELIVGEIEDEYDDQAQDQPSIRALDEYRYTINALTPIEDFNEHFGSHFSDDDVDTIGGLVMHGFGHLPKRGESIELSGFEFKILQVDRRRLIQLQVTIPEQRTDNEME